MAMNYMVFRGALGRAQRDAARSKNLKRIEGTAQAVQQAVEYYEQRMYANAEYLLRIAQARAVSDVWQG
jgi:hypothetical protein